MQNEQDQKLEFVCLSLHTNFEHDEEPTKAITTTTTETPQNPKKKKKKHHNTGHHHRTTTTHKSPATTTTANQTPWPKTNLQNPETSIKPETHNLHDKTIDQTFDWWETWT